MSEKEINVKLLRKDIELILAEPRRLYMDTFAAKAESFVDDPDERPPCGTVMCIAGLTVLAQEQERGFFRKRFDQAFIIRLNMRAQDEAREALGLTVEQSRRLFYFKSWRRDEVGWPEKFSTAYRNARTPKQRAAATAARIRHFIKTNGAE